MARKKNCVPATPKNLAIDARRKEHFELAFEKWEKQFNAALKKKSGYKDLEVYLKQLHSMVREPGFGFIFCPPKAARRR